MLVEIKPGVWVQTRHKELLARVDAFKGDPTPEQIRALAEEFGDTVPFIESCFRTRHFRRRQRERWVRSSGTRKSKLIWNPETLRALEELFRRGLSDEEIARAMQERFGPAYSLNQIKRTRCWLGYRRFRRGSKTAQAA